VSHDVIKLNGRKAVLMKTHSRMVEFIEKFYINAKCIKKGT
jgi:hypothetical protein